MRSLRKDLGFDGVVFSDDLEMRAVADTIPIRDRVLGAFEVVRTTSKRSRS